jgi:hypothetical protein
MTAQPNFYESEARMTLRYLVVSGLVIAAAHLASLRAADDTKRSWNFDGDALGQIAKGFSGEVGTWTVVNSDSGNALAQSAKNANAVFNIALIGDTNAKDVDLSVRMKAVAGETDQGGGLVWRAKDAKNYYLVRYNPLEDNYRLYKVVDGKRTLIQNVDIPHSAGWHTLRVTMIGDQIACYYDGKKFVESKDTTFPAAGKIGLWSKADAQTQFDDLTLGAP